MNGLVKNMNINFAHIRQPSTSGGWVDFAVFDAKSASGSESDNAKLLMSLTNKARLSGKKVDQSALAFSEHGRVKFYGTKNLVDYLFGSGVPQWTHSINV